MTDNMDKIISVNTGQVNTAADNNWVQVNTVLLDNSSSNIEKTVMSMMLNGSLWPNSANKVYYGMILVTAEDGVVPNFAGSTATMNAALTSYRRLIWCTQSGFVKANAGVPDDEIVTMEPGTKRILRPGQKLVYVLLAANHGAAGADNLYFIWDCNIWFGY